jgi:hypothetical protein
MWQGYAQLRTLCEGFALKDHGKFVLNTYSNKNKLLDAVHRVTNGNNKQK